MNSTVVENYARLKGAVFFLPLFVLLSFVFFLYSRNALTTNAYISIQKDYFYSLNSELGQFPGFIYNLTQAGDTLVLLSLLSVYIVFAPAIWEALITSTLISAIVSVLLKNIFSVPRPAAVFDNDTFIIIGQKLPGHSSLPSGHSMTVFMAITVLLFAFMPQKKSHQILWVLFNVSLGLLLSFTRVGVGAHYPLDVLAGSMAGYLTGIAGIFFCRKYKIWSWVGNSKYYPFFMLLLLIASVVMISKIIDEALPVYCLGLTALIFSFYKITHVYIKR